VCSVCLKSPCDPRCPNAPEPKSIYICNHCGEPIVEGEDYADVDGDYYHEECFTDCAAGILLEKYGAAIRTAEHDG